MTATHVQTMEEFRALTETPGEEKLVVVDFTASWCGPCQAIAPIFQKMAEDNPDVVFAKVDVDEAQDVSAACGIEAMPTFQFFKGGSKIEVLRGANKDKLHALVKELRVPSVVKSRESELKGFFDACLGGNMEEARQHIKKYPDYANQPTPPEWHDYHIMRKGWQPVESTLNPGVMNAKGTVFLRANHPSFALHLAAGNGHTDMIKLLLEAKADLEAKDGDGDTALAWATWSGRREAMDQLCAAGADSSFAETLSRKQFEGVQGDGNSLEYLKEKRRKA